MVKFNNNFSFGTKAETLTRLKPLLKKCRIPNFYSFTVNDWIENPDAICETIKRTFNDSLIIVRSSSLSEDGGNSALAGAFLSVPNINPQDHNGVIKTIKNVIQSYSKTDDEIAGINPENQVLIQEMITTVSMSGVLFTQDLNTGAPYYVINYDDETGSTDSITSGQYNNRTLYVLRNKLNTLKSERFINLLTAVQEIEKVVKDNCLDIEFGLNNNNEVLLFQVRRITTQPNWNRGIAINVLDAVSRNIEFLEQNYGLSEDKEPEGLDVVLGNMPDWNPAEMIGTAPRPLAYSLYRHLITDRAWRIARDQMGYHHRIGQNLMVSLSGQPFIDVRESFYSYLPANLPLAIQEKLVTAWLKKLRENHHLHDKVEFDVAITVYTFDFDDQIGRLIKNVLTEEELKIYRNSLHQMTNSLLSGEVACIEDQFNKVNALASRRLSLLENIQRPDLQDIAALLEDAIENGTIPFSILARHGFIASSMLRSMQAKGIMSHDEITELQKSIPTVATDLLQDMANLSKGKLTKSEFLNKYGHLRPGTYDILSLRYDERGDTIFSTRDMPEHEEIHFNLTSDLENRLQSALDKAHFDISPQALLHYIRRAIQGREYAKFIFTHNLSSALEIISAWGKINGLSRDELSFLSIDDILNTRITPQGRSLEEFLRTKSQEEEKRYQVTTATKLPFLITCLQDLSIVPLAVDQPNFITRKNISAERIIVNGSDTDPTVLDDKIVVIESADPGFDWIFSRNIKGLITKFGGANSHMAIRCAEFELPAAIGCGEQIFERISKSAFIELQCAEGQIKFIEE